MLSTSGRRAGLDILFFFNFNSVPSFLKIYLFIYLFLAAFVFVAARGLLTVVASLAAEDGL